jgi:hypothetical protein
MAHGTWWQLECLEGYSNDGYIVIFKHDKNVVLFHCSLISSDAVKTQ